MYKLLDNINYNFLGIFNDYENVSVVPINSSLIGNMSTLACMKLRSGNRSSMILR